MRNLQFALSRPSDKEFPLQLLFLFEGRVEDFAKFGLLWFATINFFRPAIDMAVFAAAGAVLGHCFPVWLGFKGGKGVATFLGIWLALDWRIGAACCLTWLVAAAIWRISSLAALVAAAMSIVWVLVLTDANALLLGILLTGLVFWRHGANIGRIRAGTEPKIGRS